MTLEWVDAFIKYVTVCNQMAALFAVQVFVNINHPWIPVARPAHFIFVIPALVLNKQGNFLNDKTIYTQRLELGDNPKRESGGLLAVASLFHPKQP